MRKLIRLFLAGLILVSIFVLNSCVSNSSFSQDELKFVNPYLKSDTVIYKSSQGITDTIIFASYIVDTVRVRNLSQGYYNENTLRVRYKLTNNSFHKLLQQSLNNEPIDFISFSKVKNSHSTKEIYFLGLLFNKDFIEDLIKTNTSEEVIFKGEKAQYTGLNINKGIKSFTFNFLKGVVSFIDDSDGEWIRVN